MRGINNREANRDGLRPDPVLGKLLQSIDHTPEMMSWSAVERLVATAPPVRVPWMDSLVNSGSRQLRFAAMAVVMAIAGTGLLAVLPAQSDQVGTLVLTKLPSAWPVAGEAFTEVKSAAKLRFADLGAPQSDLFMVVGERAGRDELALMMLGVDTPVASGFFNGLCQSYPALDAFDAEIIPINADRFDNRLNELIYRVSHQGGLALLDDTALKSFAVKALGNSGFGDVRNVEITRMPDGRIIIKVEASFDVAVERGHMREELEAAGLSRELLGDENFQRLLDELAAP